MKESFLRFGPFIRVLYRVKYAILAGHRARTDPVAAVFALADRLPGWFLNFSFPLVQWVLGICEAARVFPPQVAPLKAAILATRGRREQAYDYVEQRLQRLADPIGRARLAQVALRTGREDLAGEALQGLTHPSAPVQEARAQLLLREGRLEDARTVLQQLILTGAGSPNINRQLTFLAGRIALLRGEWTWTPSFRAPSPTPIPGRILHLLTNSLPHKRAGYTVRSHSVALSQRQVGLEPHLVTRAGFPQMQGIINPTNYETIDDVPYHRIPIQGLPPFPDDTIARQTADGLIRLAHRIQPSCLHPASYHVNGQIALATARHLGIPVVYEVRGFLEETWLASRHDKGQDHTYYQWSKDAESDVMLSVNHVITLSEVMRQEIISRGVPDCRTTVIPNAVDEQRFFPAEAPAPLRSSLGLSPTVATLGYIGSLVDYEGLPTLISALSKLHHCGYNVHFICIGDGPEFQNLNSQVAQLGLQNSVTFTGHLPHHEIPQYYRLMHAFIVPRRDRRVCRLVTPLKPIEAMASGVPLVTSELAPLLELSGQGAAGPAFPPEDPDALAQTIADLLNDPQAQRQHSWQGRKRVLQEYTWTANAGLYKDIYSRLGAL